MDKLEMIKRAIWDATDGEQETKLTVGTDESRVVILGSLIGMIVGIIDDNIILKDDGSATIINQTEAIATMKLMAERIY